MTTVTYMVLDEVPIKSKYLVNESRNGMPDKFSCAQETNQYTTAKRMNQGDIYHDKHP